MTRLHVPRQSGHSGKCGEHAPKPGPEIPAHDVFHLDWESVRDTVEEVKAYVQEWDHYGTEDYVVKLEAVPRIVERLPPEDDETCDLPLFS